MTISRYKVRERKLVDEIEELLKQIHNCKNQTEEDTILVYRHLENALKKYTQIRMKINQGGP
ncbi:hypothetical protein [Pelosinus sp. sgz500959]|uniref:hypothetical protein n=1 Tax=Pelosinus sp. sgz500959 TaxID=3242472 RepID=UPI0036703BFA